MSSSDNTSVGVLSHLDDYNEVPDALDDILRDVDLDFGRKPKSAATETESVKGSSSEKQNAERPSEPPKSETPIPSKFDDMVHKGEQTPLRNDVKRPHKTENHDNYEAAHKKTVRQPKSEKTHVGTAKSEVQPSSAKEDGADDSEDDWKSFLSFCSEERTRTRNKNFGGNAKNVAVDVDIINLFKLCPIEGNSITTIVNSVLRLFISRYKSNILDNKNLARIQSMLEIANQLKNS